MKQNEEVNKEQFLIFLLVFVDLQPIYLSLIYRYFEQSTATTTRGATAIAAALAVSTDAAAHGAGATGAAAAPTVAQPPGAKKKLRTM